MLYQLLQNRVYLGGATHKGQSYPGEHAAIVDCKLWDRVHAVMDESRREGANRARPSTPALLRGLNFGPNGRTMTPTYSRRRGRLYRYYVATAAVKEGYAGCPVRSVSAAEVEGAVLGQLRRLLQSPEIVAAMWRAAQEGSERPLSEAGVARALRRLNPLWEELFPAEQRRIVRLLVERVDVLADALQLQLRLRAAGLLSLVEDLRGGDEERRNAA